MAHKKDADDSRGHGFDLAAIAADGPVVGNDPSNGIGWSDDVPDAFRRTGQANIAGLGFVGF